MTERNWIWKQMEEELSHSWISGLDKWMEAGTHPPEEDVCFWKEKP